MKTAIVSGASTGIGRAVALELSKNDFETYLLGRNEKQLNETKSQIEKIGGQAQIFLVDLSSVESVKQLIATLKTKLQRLDLIANIAGIWHGKDEVFAGKDFETFDQQVVIDTLNVGVTAPTLLVHGLLPLMKSGSKIINLSGTFENGAKGWLPYYVSKRGIEDLTVALAQELEEKDIRVNCVSPSDTATEAYAQFFPQYIPDAVEPVEIARHFVKLADSENKVTGKVFVIKKGMEVQERFHF